METEATQQQAPTETETPAVVSDSGETESITTYLDGKYKSVSDLEKGYKELQSSYSKKLGAFEGAPEAYVLPDGIESNSKIEALQAWGKENQLSNKALNAILEMDATISEQETQAYIASQKELLGKDADIRLNNIQDWAKANVGEADFETFKGMINSAKAVEMFERIAKNSLGTTAAQAPAQPMVDRETLQQMRFAKDQYGNRRMSSDPAYRAKVIALEEQLR